MVSYLPDANFILQIAFNQDCSCFTLATSKGFSVFATYPYQCICERGDHHTELTGGIGIAQMLFKTNIVCLVGGGPRPRFPENKLSLWDDHQLRCVSDLSFKSEVKGVQIRRNRLAVVLELKVIYYIFEELKVLDQIETCRNPLGVCSLSIEPQTEVLACLDRKRGHIRIQLYDQDRTVITSAHDSAITCMCISQDGKRLAASADKGTLIRVFNTNDGVMTHELRRGIDKALINFMTFDTAAEWLACCSEKDSVHIFVVKDEADLNQVRNTTSSLGFIRRILPKYFDSEWSFAKLRVSGSIKVCAFGPLPGSIAGRRYTVVSFDGVYYFASFDLDKGGDCVVQVIKRLPVTSTM